MEKEMIPGKKRGIAAFLEASNATGKTNYDVEGIDELAEVKEKRLKEFGLPMERRFGVFSDLETARQEIEEKLAPEEFERIKFYIRCLPKVDTATRLKRQRKFDCTWSDLESFVRQLPGGADKYLIELREDEPADYSGTIIANGDGKIVIEIVDGQHRNMEVAGLGESLYKAGLDLNSGEIHFAWDGDPETKVKEVGINALKYFVPNLDREELERLKVYTEFSWHDGKFRFYFVSTDNFWTKL